MSSKGESFQHGDEHTNTKDLAEKWQKDLNELVCGTFVNPVGRLRQAALITEGLVFGGISEIENHRNWETAIFAGEAAVAGGILGTLMASRLRGLKTAVTWVGSLAGIAYAGSLWDKYSKDKDLTKALDTVYKNGELKSFNDQALIANSSLGKEGFNIGLTGLAGGFGMMAGSRFAPTLALRHGSPEIKRMFFDMPYTSSNIATTVNPAFSEYRATSVLSGHKEFVPDVKVGHEAVAAEVSGMAAPMESKLACGNELVNIFANGQYKHKVSLDKFVRKIVDGEVGIEFGEAAGYKFDGKNNLQSVVVGPGASSDEVARRLLVGSSASQIGEWEAPMQAARQGSHGVGYDAPHPGDLAKTYTEGKPFHESNIGQFRRSEGVQRYAVEGSESYYKGEAGNDYTDFLKRQHGEWTSERKSAAESMLTDSTHVDSPFNPNYFAAQDILSTLAIKPTAGNRAAASNLWINSMTKAGQLKAVRAVSRYLEQHPSVVELTGAEKNSAIGKLASELTSNEVEIITDTYFRTNGELVPIMDKELIEATGSLMKAGYVRKAATAYRLLTTHTGGHLSNERLDAAMQFIKSARDTGISESELMADNLNIGDRLHQLLVSSSSNMIPDYAQCLRIFGSATTSDDICAVNALRRQGWDINRLNKHEVAATKQIIMSGKLPTEENVAEALLGFFPDDH